MRAYIRINDENIVASPVLFVLWRESQQPQGALITYNDDIRKLLDVMQGQQTLNQIVRHAKLPRHKVISLLAHLIRFGTVRWEYVAPSYRKTETSTGCCHTPPASPS